MFRVLYVETNTGQGRYMQREYAPLQERMNKPAAVQGDNESFWFI